MIENITAPTTNTSTPITTHKVSVNTVATTTPYTTLYSTDTSLYSVTQKSDGIAIIKPSAIVHLATDIIMDIKILKKNKVVRFTFTDGTKIKTICEDEDPFSLEYACFLAIAKKKYSKTLTFEGVLKKAEELQYEKVYVKAVQKALREYNKKIQEEEKKKEQEKEEKAMRLRKQAKKAEKKKRQAARQVADIVTVLKEELNK